MRDRERLLAAYVDTTYRVFMPDAVFTLRVGRRHLSLDRALAVLGAREWAHVTAWNPRSTRRDGAANERAQAALLGVLEARGYRWMPGEGAADDGGWRESSVLVLGMPVNEALELAHGFGQLAILCGRAGEAARLEFCDRPGDGGADEGAAGTDPPGR